MLSLDYSRYLDKVFGCWLGKCVAGTIGAPYEGAKELFDFEYDPKLIESMLPNDDLDLQVLWLSVLEEKGVAFTSDDLADAFYHRCPYAPGEYAYFKKNFSRGIHPPVSGSFNNRYYQGGMGCPIRSEIWGCIAPGNPRLAAELAAKDGVVDHGESASVCAEQFLAAMESAAFFESDIDELVGIGLSAIESSSPVWRHPVECLVNDVREWCRASDDWRYVRSRVIRSYGHPDCTNMLQNIGITLLALYLGEGDFLKTTMMALNCGYDTDCTCATAGAIIGIIEGAKSLMDKHGFTDQGFVLGVDAPRRSDRVLHLAEDTCAMGLHFAEHLNTEVSIAGAPAAPVIRPVVPAVEVSVGYTFPALKLGDRRRLVCHFRNTTDSALSGTARLLNLSDGWELASDPTDLSLQSRKDWAADSVSIGLQPGGTALWEFVVTVPDHLPVLREQNLMTLEFAIYGGEIVNYTFGLVGASIWQVYGPFWENRTRIPKLEVGESYYKHLSGSGEDDLADNVRDYHLNAGVDIAKEYMTLDELLNPQPTGDAAREPQLVNCCEDMISMKQLIGYQGPCAIYMVRRMISPEDRVVGLQIGHTDAYKLWINGELVSERENVDWWTAENAHIHNFPIRKGENTIVVRLSRRSEDACFSLIFSKGGSCTEHYADFASVNPSA